MNSEFDVLRDVIGRLDGAGIPYMLTGSIAMSVHAEPRMTRDVDIVVELAERDVGRVVELFAKDYYVSEEAVRSAISNRGLFNLFHYIKLVKVDLILRSEDEFQAHIFARRGHHVVRGQGAWVIAKEDLILAKLAWAAPSGSAFQLRDVRKLLTYGADVAYLQFWSRKLGIEALLLQCLDERHDT